MDITKDRLYCDGKDDTHRRASQSAMAMIVKQLLTLMAPIITYTCDEIVENAPAIIKGDAEDIFDFVYEPMEKVESSLDSEYMKQARFGFGSAIDGLKKDKTIKATLELTIYTNSDKILALDPTEAEDWFVVSGVGSEKGTTELGSFKVEDDEFIIYKAEQHKCPRCWKFNSEAEDTTCSRCSEVLA